MRKGDSGVALSIAIGGLLYIVITGFAQAQTNTIPAPLTTQIVDCLSQATSAQPPQISKARIDKSSENIVVMTCFGKEARDLYSTLRPYAIQETITLDDGRELIYRMFGKDQAGTTDCSRVLAMPDGSVPSDEAAYQCNFRIDVNDAVKNGM